MDFTFREELYDDSMLTFPQRYNAELMNIEDYLNNNQIILTNVTNQYSIYNSEIETLSGNFQNLSNQNVLRECYIIELSSQKDANYNYEQNVENNFRNLENTINIQQSNIETISGQYLFVNSSNETLSGNVANLTNIVENTFSSHYIDTSSVAGSASINGNKIRLTLTEDTILENPSNLNDGQEILMRIKQDGIGNHLLTFGDKYRANYNGLIIKEPNQRYFLKGVYDKEDDVVDCVVIQKNPQVPQVSDFTFIVDTTKAGSAANQFILPLVPTGSYNFTVDWGDSSTCQITSYNQAEATHTYSSPGTYTVKFTTGKLSGFIFNNGGDKLKILEISKWGGLCLGTNQSGHFYGCSNLNISATDAPNLSITTSLSNAFRNCLSLAGGYARLVTPNYEVRPRTGNCKINVTSTTIAGNYLRKLESATDANLYCYSYKVSVLPSSTPTGAVNDGNGKLKICGCSDFPNLTKVRFAAGTGGTLPGNITAGVDYYLVRQSSDFSTSVPCPGYLVSTTADGLSLVNYSSAGSGSNRTITAQDNLQETNWVLGPATTDYWPSNYYDSTNVRMGISTSAVDYVPIWIYRHNTNNNVYYIRGNVYSSSTAAEAEIPSTVAKPAFLTTNCVLVGRIIQNASYTGGNSINSGYATPPINDSGVVVEAGSGSTAIQDWSTGNVTAMDNMFYGVPNIDYAEFSKWDVSNVTTMSGMFRSAGKSNFNNGANALTNAGTGRTGLNGWNVSKCTDFSTMFYYCPKFNRSLANWSTSSALNMSYMFYQCQTFDQNIGSWNVGKVRSFQEMFYSASAFNNASNSSIGNWRPGSGLSTATGLSFVNVGSTTVEITWPSHGLTDNNNDVIIITNSTNTDVLPDGKYIIIVKDENTLQVTANAVAGSGTCDAAPGIRMYGMFNRCRAFNQNIGAWTMGNVTNTEYMFIGAGVGASSNLFNNGGSPDINGWDVSNVTSMYQMFKYCSVFNQPIGGWNTVSVTNMQRMFESAVLFNQDIGNWNMQNVTNMEAILGAATAFNNGDLTDIASKPINWSTPNATNMYALFVGCSSFNQALPNLNTSKVGIFEYMFNGCTKFNQSLAHFDTSKGSSFRFMLSACPAFKQSLAAWNVISATSGTSGFDAFMVGSDMNAVGTTTNYDATLLSWAAQGVKDSVNANFGTSKYSAAAQVSRDHLTTAVVSGGHGWTISDGGSVVTRYWVATGAGNWNSTANWSTTSGGAGGASVPGLYDVAYFNGGTDGSKSGNCTINADVRVAGLAVGSRYTGTISQGAFNVVAGEASTYGFYQETGTYTGGAGTVTVYGPLIIAGGAFTGGDGSITASSILVTGGTFISSSTTTEAQQAQVNNPGVFRLATNGILNLTGSGTPLSGTGTVDTSTNNPTTIQYTGQATVQASAQSYRNLTMNPSGFGLQSRLKISPDSAVDADIDAAAIDTTGGYAYFVNKGASFSTVYKVRLSDFKVAARLPLAAGESGALPSFVDATSQYLYVGLRTSPGKIVKIRLSDFSKVSTLTLPTGENNLYSAVYDPAGYAYFGTRGLAGGDKIIKIQLSDLTRVGAITLTPTAEDLHFGAAIDTAGGFAYFLTNTDPCKVIKIQLSNFTRVADLTLSAGESYSRTAFIASGFLYAGLKTAGANGKLVKIQLSDFSHIGVLDLNAGEMLCSSVVDTTAGIAYLGTDTTPGYVVRVRLSDFTRIDAIDTGATGLFCAAAIDTTGGFAYFPDDSGASGETYGIVCKVRLGSTAPTMRFVAGSTYTVDGALILTGAAGRVLTLQSSAASQWNINPSGSRTVDYVNVSYSNNTNVTAITATNSTDGGNNTNWSFA